MSVSANKLSLSGISFVLLIVFLLNPFALILAQDEQEEWSQRKDKDGIQVYTRSVEGSPYREVQVVTTIQDIRLSSLAALLLDAEACPEWADKCDESYVHEQISETEFYVYSNNDMPFPVTDRDALTYVTWVQDPETLAVTMTSIATSDILPKQRGRLSLTEARTSWQFIPQADGSIDIVNASHINPGSMLPGWVTNMLLVDTPYQTMSDFIVEVRKPKYLEAEVSFIQDF